MSTQAEVLQGKIQKLVDRQGSLRAQIERLRNKEREIRVFLREHKRKQSKSRQYTKINKVIRSLGGREKFIKNHSGGRLEDSGFRSGGCEYISALFCYEKECAYLGVSPNLVVFHCSFPAKRTINGTHLCGLHYKKQKESGWVSSDIQRSNAKIEAFGKKG